MPAPPITASTALAMLMIISIYNALDVVIQTSAYKMPVVAFHQSIQALFA
jgi:hypothetical protein